MLALPQSGRYCCADPRKGIQDIRDFMPRILVCDDEPLISMMLQEWLTELDCETVGPASSVQTALTLIENTPPDAAILDLSLGGEDSYSVAMDLRSRRIPFAFATGYADKALDTAFKGELVVAKPFDFEAIKSLLGKLLDSKAGSGTGAIGS
jgi:CheY-like chemotaxis protein